MKNGASDRLYHNEVDGFKDAMETYRAAARQELEAPCGDEQIDAQCRAQAKQIYFHVDSALRLLEREGDRAHLLRALQEFDGMEEIAKAFECGDYSGLAI